MDETVIPGLASSRRDHNSVDAERRAAQYSCHSGNGMIDGVRPRSWFSPAFDYLYVKAEESKVVEYAGDGDGILEPGEVGSFQLGLRNESNEITSDVKVTLSSQEKFINFQNTNSSYPDLKSDNSVEYNLDKLYFKVSSDVKCGTPFYLRSTVRSNHGTASLKEKFYLGSFQAVDVGMVDEVIELEPFTLNFSKMENSESGPVTKAEVSIDIYHQTVRAVKFFLIAPDGTEKFLANPPTTFDDVQLTETIDIPVSDGKGEWTLKIVDDQPISKGYLRSWKLKLHRPHCQ